MKKITLLYSSLICLFVLASCEGPAGPPGPPGQDGSFFEAAAFEIQTNLAYNAQGNTYELLFEPYPSDIVLLPDDVILMYRLEEVDQGVDVWRQMPQPYILNVGTFYYNFDFTQGDYSIYVEADFDVTQIPSDLTQSQIFRIVVIPANLGIAPEDLDTSNINAVLEALGTEVRKLPNIQM